MPAWALFWTSGRSRVLSGSLGRFVHKKGGVTAREIVE